MHRGCLDETWTLNQPVETEAKLRVTFGRVIACGNTECLIYNHVGIEMDVVEIVVAHQFTAWRFYYFLVMRCELVAVEYKNGVRIEHVLRQIRGFIDDTGFTDMNNAVRHFLEVRNCEFVGIILYKYYMILTFQDVRQRYAAEKMPIPYCTVTVNPDVNLFQPGFSREYNEEKRLTIALNKLKHCDISVTRRLLNDRYSPTILKTKPRFAGLHELAKLDGANDTFHDFLFTHVGAVENSIKHLAISFITAIEAHERLASFINLENLFTCRFGR